MDLSQQRNAAEHGTLVLDTLYTVRLEFERTSVLESEVTGDIIESSDLSRRRVLELEVQLANQRHTDYGNQNGF